MSFALSTSWNARRYQSGKALIFEIKKAGFSEVELSFNLTAGMVKDIEKSVQENQVRVLSLHNFCPIPDGLRREVALPDYYAISSLEERQRQKALKFTKETIDTAVRLGAQAVVLHCGKIGVPDKTRKLIELFASGRKDTLEFRALRDGLIRERQRYAKKFFANTLRSLGELNAYAAKAGISLGVENRFYYREIPSFEEIGVILNTFKGGNIFYWHDTGHAQVMENLKLAKHQDYLRYYADKLLGIHLHDLIGCVDHQAPGRGEFDFQILKPYLERDTLKIIEAHEQASAQDLKTSKIFLEKIFNAGS